MLPERGIVLPKQPEERSYLSNVPYFKMVFQFCPHIKGDQVSLSLEHFLSQTSAPLPLAWTSGMATPAAASGQGEQKTRDAPQVLSEVLQWTHEVCGAVRKPLEVQRGHLKLSRLVVALMKEVPFLLKPTSTHPTAASPR